MEDCPPAQYLMPSLISESRTQDAIASDRTLVGFDLGGTKCAVSRWHDGQAQEVLRIPTGPFATTFPQLLEAAHKLVAGHEADFGVSSGGPLNATDGIILNPPNLPSDWHGLPICRLLTERHGGRATLMNDANACALAEWKFGAGRDCRNMIFLTSGTGMGAGLILDGRLYEGATGDAGEIGHVRIRCDGPIGYGKAGSVEGFTSGGGIPRLAARLLRGKGGPAPAWFSPVTTTRQIAEVAQKGDPFAIEVMRTAGTHLGESLAILIDLFNPDRIVLGGFYPPCRLLLEPALNAALNAEALPGPTAACQILPSTLGETIGSHGAIAAALHRRES